MFEPDTSIEAMVDVLDTEPDIDLCAGLVRFDGRNATNYCGDFQRSGRAITVVPPSAPEQATPRGVPYQRCDLVFNFYLARREELLAADPWDKRFKIGEHVEFFLSCAAKGVRCCFTPASVVGHLKEANPTYRDYRTRAHQFLPLLLEKWNLDSALKTRIQPVPGVGQFDVAEHVELQRRQRRPNLIVFGIGHSGTSIVTRLLLNLGWNCPEADDEYAEHVGLRELNTQALRDLWRPDAARDLLAQLPEPWVLKDPRLLHTIDLWLPLLHDAEPTLLWLTRDLADVAASYRRRGEGGDGPEVITRGLTLPEAYNEAARVYRDWPFAKLQLSYEQVRAAVGLFDVGRTMNQNAGFVNRNGEC